MHPRKTILLSFCLALITTPHIRAQQTFWTDWRMGPPSTTMADSSYGSPNPAAPRKQITIDPYFKLGWEDAAVAGFHVASSCLISGFGAVSNHKNFGIACLGGAGAGTLLYAGSKLGTFAGYYAGVGYGAKGITSLGASIRDNLAQGIGPFSRFQYDLAFLRLSIGDAKSNDGMTVNYYVLPAPIISSAYAWGSGARWDTETSLKLGTPVYRGDVGAIEQNSNNKEAIAFSMPTIIVNENYTGEERDVLGHEFIHTLNYREMSWIDAVFENHVYGDRFSKYHLKLGGEIGAAAMAPFLLLEHNSRPQEMLPEALQLRPQGSK